METKVDVTLECGTVLVSTERYEELVKAEATLGIVRRAVVDEDSAYGNYDRLRFILGISGEDGKEGA